MSYTTVEPERTSPLNYGTCHACNFILAITVFMEKGKLTYVLIIIINCKVHRYIACLFLYLQEYGNLTMGCQTLALSRTTV